MMSIFRNLLSDNFIITIFEFFGECLLFGSCIVFGEGLTNGGSCGKKGGFARTYIHSC